MASTEATAGPGGEECKPKPVKAPPALDGFFKAGKKKKPAGAAKKKEEKPAADEWGAEEEVLPAAPAEVKVAVEDLAKKEDEAKEEEVKGPIWKKKDEDRDSKTQTLAFPSLGATVKKETAKGSAIPVKAAGFKTHQNQFAELHDDEREDDDASHAKKQARAVVRTEEEQLAAERKADKKAAKKAEKEARLAVQATETEKENETRDRGVKINGVLDTEIKADLLAIEEKFNGRRKLEPQPLEAADEDVVAPAGKKLLGDSSDEDDE